ncbi:31937_t:CDS:1, partial [Racocetra persica]
ILIKWYQILESGLEMYISSQDLKAIKNIFNFKTGNNIGINV